MPTKNYLEKALELAREAALDDEVPVGAVIVHDGKIVGEGRNTRERDQNPLKHAELIAIENAARTVGSWRLIDCDLYVTLEPCPMCLAACQQSRVRKVVYGAKDGKGGAICLGYHIYKDPKVNHRFEVVYEPNEECSSVLSQFFAAKRRKK
ncbi:MAG: nucleoside deaminase [Bdellovibrionales bacterium]|nr:nucleoside deaminase [Bdellovibrionales bacterium]